MEYSAWWLEFKTLITRGHRGLEDMHRDNAIAIDGDTPNDDAIARKHAKKVIKELKKAVIERDRKKLLGLLGDNIGQEGDGIKFSKFRLTIATEINLKVRIPKIIAKS